MAVKFRRTPPKTLVRKFIEPIEAAVLSQDYFSLQKGLGYADKLKLLRQYIRLPLSPQASSPTLEINFVLYSKACERLLVPLIINLLQRSEHNTQNIKVNVMFFGGIQNLQLSTATQKTLTDLGCQIQGDYFSLIRACHQPLGKVAVLCLDHRHTYQFHCWGVDTAEKLNASGVKTVCIQHGGTREDSVRGLASSESQITLVWGKRVYRELIEQYKVPQAKLRLVGNPLHDPLPALNQEHILKTLANTYPNAQAALDQNKRLILLAACLHTEYRGHGDEQAMYRRYMQHIYESLDFSKVFLLIKMHPLDTLTPNLYKETLPKPAESSVCVIEPSVVELDCYSLLSISEVLITRASTVAEEALLLGKKVVAFDLIPDGPSKSYHHLKEYGAYTYVYAEPEDALQDAISQSLASSMPEPHSSIDLTAEFTYCLDGNSTQRSTDAILAELQ